MYESIKNWKFLTIYLNIKMEELPYWIIDNKLIFKPDFNDELDNYYDVISQHNELIFSNYNDPEITIKTNNKYLIYHSDYNDSTFNKNIILTENITNLSFGDYFCAVCIYFTLVKCIQICALHVFIYFFIWKSK